MQNYEIVRNTSQIWRGVLLIVLVCYGMHIKHVPTGWLKKVSCCTVIDISMARQ